MTVRELQAAIVILALIGILCGKAVLWLAQMI